MRKTASPRKSPRTPSRPTRSPRTGSPKTGSPRTASRPTRRASSRHFPSEKGGSLPAFLAALLIPLFSAFPRPQLFARDARALDHRLEFRPPHRGVDFRLARPLRREAAVAARHHVLAPDDLCVAHEALGDELGMLHDIRRVADDAGDENFSFRQLDTLPHAPLVLVARGGRSEERRVGT